MNILTSLSYYKYVTKEPKVRPHKKMVSLIGVIDSTRSLQQVHFSHYDFLSDEQFNLMLDMLKTLSAYYQTTFKYVKIVPDDTIPQFLGGYLLFGCKSYDSILFAPTYGSIVRAEDGTFRKSINYKCGIIPLIKAVGRWNIKDFINHATLNGEHPLNISQEIRSGSIDWESLRINGTYNLDVKL